MIRMGIGGGKDDFGTIQCRIFVIIFVANIVGSSNYKDGLSH